MMNPRVVKIKPQNDHTLKVYFSNGETKVFDVKPYLTVGIFKELKEMEYFKRAKVCFGSVTWPHGQDFCPDTLYEDSLSDSQEAAQVT